MTAAGIILLVIVGQNFDQRGFFENQTLFYPQNAANDSGKVVNQDLFRWEPSYKTGDWFKLSGAFDARTDSHRQVERDWRFDVDDRSIERPAFSLRRLSLTLHKGFVTAEIGRQFIRWGKTDILAPTDRFAPKDYLSSVVDSDFLGVDAARVTLNRANDSLDLVWQPWFTPSRTPLMNQRWTVLPPQALDVSIIDAGARYPGGSEVGARWNHVATGYEYSLSYFRGHDYFPLLDAQFAHLPFAPPAVTAQRFYPQMQMAGGDAAVQFAWVTAKAEAGYFTSSTPGAQDYVLYVIQLERQVKEWSLVGGYAGDAVLSGAATPLQFAPDRGFARSFVGRAALTIDVNRSLTFETAVRAAGSFLRLEYSQAFGQHWRATPGLAWIRGDMSDFLGQYRHNSYATLAVRYSF
ncbi:MAG TPA: hypothetical protein VGR73_08610 [Bryobacteraceae bacterium]|nr:hypothetical protein [Bryobacteraceae bacterium]